MAFHLQNSIIITLIALGITQPCEALTIKSKCLSRKSVETSQMTLYNHSEIHCVRKCHEENTKGLCSIAGYNKTTQTCHLSVDNHHDVLDVDEETSVVCFLSQEQGQECVDPGPLIDGSIPIPDDHMTASSEWDITLTPLWTALYARMSSATGWCAAQQDIDAAVPSFYLQVQFIVLSTVVAVQTAGHKYTKLPQNHEYIETFRLEYSVDCTIFNEVGINLKFQGNVDGTTVVTNGLPTPVKALCFRLYPQTWHGYPDLRIEYMGCPVV